jgi:UDP-N-acetylglucosamine--N-acetylmuramyl-(pentapeptide) pyrophosphoryl-undecaprenol N-acetylglucosamine transferase
MTINQAMVALAGTICLDGWQILHLAGREHGPAVQKGHEEKKTPARVIDFTPAMADVWAVTDLTVSRCGASTCAELTATGIPSILMPYPFHKDLHQRANAMVLSDSGAAILMDDERDPQKNADKLRPALQSLLQDSAKRKSMSEAARKLGRPDAARAVAAVIAQMIAG